MKIKQSVFESAIRAKMLEPQDIIKLEVIPDDKVCQCGSTNLIPDPAGYQADVIDDDGIFWTCLDCDKKRHEKNVA